MRATAWLRQSQLNISQVAEAALAGASQAPHRAIRNIQRPGSHRAEVLSIMELRHLRYFVAIAEERSFTRAAERLWVAQPGLSTQIRQLETELGVRLFERHTRGVDLTSAGQLFLERARAVLAATEIARATGSDLTSGLVGSVRLGLASAARWSGAPALLDRFTRDKEGVELTVLEGLGGTLSRDLRDGRLDALLAPASFASADLRRLELGDEPWMALVGRTHPLAGIGPLEAALLHGQRVAVSGHRDRGGDSMPVVDLLAELGVDATLVRGAPGPALYRAVADGEALALTTAPGALPAGVLARPLNPLRTLAFELLWRDEAASPALSELVRAAAQSAEPVPESRPLAAVA